MFFLENKLIFRVSPFVICTFSFPVNGLHLVELVKLGRAELGSARAREMQEINATRVKIA